MNLAISSQLSVVSQRYEKDSMQLEVGSEQEEVKTVLSVKCKVLSGRGQSIRKLDDDRFLILGT